MVCLFLFNFRVHMFLADFRFLFFILLDRFDNRAQPSKLNMLIWSIRFNRGTNFGRIISTPMVTLNLLRYIIHRFSQFLRLVYEHLLFISVCFRNVYNRKLISFIRLFLCSLSPGLLKFIFFIFYYKRNNSLLYISLLATLQLFFLPKLELYVFDSIWKLIMWSALQNRVLEVTGTIGKTPALLTRTYRII